MVRVDLPQSRLKQRRRRRRWLIGGAIVLVLVLIAAGAAALSRAQFARVKAIEVSGTQALSSSTIQSFVQEQLKGYYLWLFPRDNIFIYPRAQIEEMLLTQYPTLREADVHAKNFTALEVKVAEREPAALWCPMAGGQGCYYMDETGLAYAQAPQFSDSPYVTYQGALSDASGGLRQYLSPSLFTSLQALIVALGQKEPGDPVRLLVVDQNGVARAYFQDDFLLIFNTGDDGGDIFSRFGLALQSDALKGKALGEMEYLDLRYGDKLYYKLKGE